MRAADPVSYRSILRVVGVVLATVALLYVLYRLRQPLGWIFFAAFLATALAGPVQGLQRHMRKGLAITVVYLGVILVPLAIGAILLPPVVTQGNELVQALPGYAADVQRFVAGNETLRGLEEDYNITDRLREQAGELPRRLGDAAGVLSGIGLGIVNSLFAGLTILILSVFLLSSGPRWLEAVARRRPPAEAELLRRTVRRVGGAVSGYCGGAVGQALVAGLSGFLVLAILGVPYAASLALLYGLLDFVPLVGATIGAVLVGIVTLFTDFPTATIVWAIYAVVYQQLENNVIQPRIQSRAVDLHPFLVLVAVLFGAALMGVVGALVAVPVAASLVIVGREVAGYRRAARQIADPEPHPASGAA